MLDKIAHLGIAVKSIDQTAALYQNLFGLTVNKDEVLAGGEVRVAFLPVGESNLELIESLNPENDLAGFIEEKGEGLHHIAFEVDNLEEKIQTLKGQGVQMIDEKPRPGASGEIIAFINPDSTGGMLLELVQKVDQ